MNKNLSKFIVFVFIGFSFYLEAVEERNLLPFYYLQKKPLKIKISLKGHKLCRVKLSDVIQYKNIEVADCYNIEKKFSESIKKSYEKNSKKNELNLMFVDGKKNIINPELQTPDGVYKVKSVLYFKKTKSHHIELIDKNGGYYYFTYDPINVTMVE